MPRLKDIVAVVGTYTSPNGETKKKYKTVGALIKTPDGREFLVLDRTFNPAGVPNLSASQKDSDQCVLNLFEPDNGFEQHRKPSPPRAASKPAPSQSFHSDFPDDIPF